MDFAQMSEIIGRITYKPGWSVLLKQDDEGRPYVQISVSTEAMAGRCARTGEPHPWKSGKRYLSPHMCLQEIVGVVFDTIFGAEEHELREWFRYRGAAIYNAHLSPDALARFASFIENFDFRKDAMSMEETANG